MPSYNIGDVFFAVDKSREEAAEYGALEDYYAEQEKRGILGDLWSFATGAAGAIIGFSVGGVPGAAKGWGYGQAAGQTLAGYDHKMDAYEDLAEMSPGKFNTAEDLTLIKEMKDDVRDDYSNTLISAGVTSLATAITVANMDVSPELTDVWADLSFKEKLASLGMTKEDIAEYGHHGFLDKDEGFFKALGTAAGGVTTKGTPAYDLSSFMTSNYALGSYLRGGNISDAIGQHLLYNMFPGLKQKG